MEGKGESSDPDIKNNTQYAFEGFQYSGRRSPYSRTREAATKISEWKSIFEGRSKGSMAMQNAVPLNTAKSNGAKSPEKEASGIRKFRFSSEYFEKRLQEKMNRLRSPFTDDENHLSLECKRNDIFENSSQERGSGGSLPVFEGRQYSPPKVLKRHSSLGIVQYQGLDKFNHSSLEQDRYSDPDQQDRYSNPDQCPGENDLFGGNFLPCVEHQPEFLNRPIQKRKDIRINDKKELGFENDDLHDQSNSESCEPHANTPHEAVDMGQKLAKASAEDHHVLNRQLSAVSHVAGSLEDNPEIYDDNWISQTSGDGIQVEALEEKITSLQDLVAALKGSIESFTMRVQEEGDRWQGKVEGMEKDFKCLKDETYCEFTEIKVSIRDELKMRLDELTRGLRKAERLWSDTDSLKESLNVLMETTIDECSAKVDFLKKQVDSLLSETKTTMTKELKETLSDTAKNIMNSLKKDLEMMEVGMSKELDCIRQEMNSKLECLRADNGKNRRMDKQQVEGLVEEKICKSLFLHVDSDTANNQRTLEGVKAELCMLWSEFQELSKGKETVECQVEHLSQIAKNAQENISKEQNLIKSDNNSLKKQIQSFQTEISQSKMDSEEFRNEIRAEMENLKQAFENLKEETENKSVDFARKIEVEDVLGIERNNILKALEMIKENEMNRKAEFDALKQAKQEFEKMKLGSKLEATRERELIIEKVENLSQLYLGALEELRSDLMLVKVTSQERLAEVEKQWEEYREQQSTSLSLPLRELVLDGLETRVAHLETNLESRNEERHNFEQERLRAEHLISLMEKDRDLASAAAKETSTSALKAGELLLEIKESLLEMATARRKNTKLQESLDLDREMVIAAISEAKKMCEDLDKEKEKAMCALLEARRKSQEIHEGLQQERSGLIHALSEVEKERDAAADAASDASAAAAKAEEALAELAKIRRKSDHIQENISQVVGQAVKAVQDKCSREFERQMNEWRRFMKVEISKVSSMAEELEEERKRFSLALIEAPPSKAEENISLQREMQERLWRSEEELAQLTRTMDEYRQEHRQTTLATQQEMEDRLQRIDEEIANFTRTVDQLKDNWEYRQTNNQIERIQRDLTHLAQKLNVLNGNKQEDGKVFSAAQKEIKEKFDRTQEELKDLRNRVEELASCRDKDMQVNLAAKKETDNSFLRLEDRLAHIGRKVENLNHSKQEIDNNFSRYEDRLATIGRKLEELSQSKQEHSQSNLQTQEVLHDRLERIDKELEELARALEQLTEFKREVLKDEVTDLREKIDEVFGTVSHLSSVVEGDGDYSLTHDIRKLENKILETASEQTNLDNQINEVEKRVKDLASKQLDLISSVQQTRGDIEKSINSSIEQARGDIEKSFISSVEQVREDIVELVPKYEAKANNILTELEKRLVTLENSGVQKSEHETKTLSEATVEIHRLERKNPDKRGISQASENAVSISIDARLLNLEDRVDTVESTTVTSLRILDAKMEHFSVGVQTALEGAAMAESKCGALGAELVKVFRMLASSRRESPTKMHDPSSRRESPLKMHDADDNNDHSGRKQMQIQMQMQMRPDSAAGGIKLKAPMTHAACSYCKKSGPCECRSNKEMKEINVKLEGHNNSSMSESRNSGIHGRQSAAESHGGIDNNHGSSSSRIRMKSSPDLNREQGLSSSDGMRAKNDSEMRALEGKLPITMDKTDAAKKGSGRSIRLEAGKVNANSNHRSGIPSLPGAKLVKRGESVNDR